MHLAWAKWRDSNRTSKKTPMSLTGPGASMEQLLTSLRAAAESTRLRILLLCGHADLTVTELCTVLGQSQPRVSRHLKLLVEAGLLDRNREGSWVFYRLSDRTQPGELARTLIDLVPADDPVTGMDLMRLREVQAAREAQAATFFKENAAKWDEIRALYVDDRQIEAALDALLPPGQLGDLLDIGTGTGRMLTLLGPRVKSAVGIDMSPEMLTVARANLDRAGLRRGQVRLGDMRHLPFSSDSFDLVTFHMVLHYAESPSAALAEAARVLRPRGRIVLIDFAPHDEAVLREEHAHQHMGFADDDMQDWLTRAGLNAEPTVRLAGQPLTVCLWSAGNPAAGVEQAA